MSESHASRRASITQLLNPVGHPPQGPPTAFSSSAITPPMSSHAHTHPHAHASPHSPHARSHLSHTPHTPHKMEQAQPRAAPFPSPGYYHPSGMSYPTLRSATWSESVASSSPPPPPPSEESYYTRTRHDHGPPPPGPQLSYSYPGPGHGGPYPEHPQALPPPRRSYEGSSPNAWGPPPEDAHRSYATHSRPPSRPDRANGERGIDRDGQSLSPYPHHPPPHQLQGYPQPASAWQNGERASTRIAARHGAQPTSQQQQQPSGMAHMPPGMMHAQPVMVPMYPVTYPSGQVGYIPVPGMFPGTMSPAQPGQGQATPTPQAHAQISEGEAASLKRGASESSGEEERSPIGPPPKAKKPRAKKQGNEESGASSVPAKRGYTSKKRESTQKAVQHAANAIVGDDGGKAKEEADGEKAAIIPELQFARCMSNRYKNEPFPRCVSCTRRWAGDTCRFQGIRFFLKNREGQLAAISFVETHRNDGPSHTFPQKWNTALEKGHVKTIKRVVAEALLPILRLEAEHLSQPQVITRPRESDVRATCDTCMTSIFSASWMCRLCGREACGDCFEQVRMLTQDAPGASPADAAAFQARREKHSHANPFFLTCTRRAEHKADDFSPMSRFCKADLDGAIKEMQEILARSAAEEGEAGEGEGISETECRWVSARPPLPHAPAGNEESISTAHAATPSDERPPSTLAIQPKVVDLPTHPTRLYDVASLTEAQFRRVWARGEPLVVEGLLDKFGIQWTPQYFKEKFGKQSCLVYDCQADKEKSIKTTVGQFFEGFGRYEGRDRIWKLKDWPPSTDFKLVFPELYADFAQAVPMPSYVRRDGVLNVASHFPLNSLGPDLGPKMYNALASSEKPGSMGSTRLHMDMADAVNIMTWSASTPTGGDGCAAWDLFRAEDADTLRAFLRDKFAIPLQQDPIHAQQYYLDSELRRQLHEKYGVISHRIYQRPGQAVFIPAGCAHQVCNLADCVKVAIDFVSPENVAKCERLTREFREQNQSLVWKEDVLQLRTMMWFAWLSCSRQEKML